MASIGIPDILIYLTDESGLNYYVANSNRNGIYSMSTTTIPTPITTLPIGWDDIPIKWARHPEYLGVFRSETKQFSFVSDARAILLNLFYSNGGGVQAKCLMRIDKFIDINNGYQTAYISDIDFSNPDDEKQNSNSVGTGGNPNKLGEFKVSTLDSRLYTLLQSLGDTEFNIPIFQNTGSILEPIWITDANFVLHEGIKLLYQANYISAASVNNLLDYTGSNNILGFNLGAHGTGVNDGFHTIPTMTEYSITQNNGTTTFIGNDILANIILQQEQQSGVNAIVNEDRFNGINNSQPYTRNNYCIKNALPTQEGYISMSVACSGTFSGNVIYAGSIGLGVDSFIRFVLFEIAPEDLVTLDVHGQYSYITIFSIPLPNGSSTYVPPNSGNFSNYDNPSTFELKDGLVYIFGIIYDSPTGQSGAFSTSFKLSQLQFSIFSKYDNGESGVPIPAPSLNPSVFPAFRLHQILEKIVPYLDTTNTDLYGFPIQTPTPYSGQSTFLSNPNQLPIGDLVPYDIQLTSSYCIHDLKGQSYITISLNQLFSFCKKHLGCGLSIQPNNNIIEIERLSNYFDSTTEIFNLASNVSKLKVKPFNDLAGNNLKLGYSKADTNSDFGVEAINTELFFNTPLTKLNNTIDLEEANILTEQHAIEKIRAQTVSQPIGSSFDPANPSTDNQIVALYCQHSNDVILPENGSVLYNIQPFDPSNNPIDCIAYRVKQRSDAQSNDPTAYTSPFIFGTHYPDTVINLELSPCRSLQRDSGSLLHSVLDLMEDEDLVFRNTSVMQYNNVELALSGIQSNLVIGGTNPITTEFQDIAISSLPNKLFRPFLLEIETIVPINAYQIISSNPNGYISLNWKGVVFMGFIWEVIQMLSASKPTTLTLICHPSTTNEQLINA